MVISDAVRVAVLGVAGGLRAPGAQGLEVVELETVAAQVELDVLRQRAVADGQDEPVATDPGAVARVTTHDLLEEQVRGGRQAHRGAGVTVADLLDRVGREDADRVYCFVVNGFPLQICHWKLTLLDANCAGSIRSRADVRLPRRRRLGRTHAGAEIGTVRPVIRDREGVRLASTCKYRDEPPSPVRIGRGFAVSVDVHRLDSLGKPFVSLEDS